MAQPGQLKALGARFFDAVLAGDLDTVREIYAPDAIIWHAHTNAEQSVEDNLKTLLLVAQYIKDFRYENRRLQATEHGFVEQHVTRGTTPTGAEFSIAACIICTVIDGRITRLEEYFDSAAAAPLLQR
jgi:ketosteroid isomerase-like protein